MLVVDSVGLYVVVVFVGDGVCVWLDVVVVLIDDQDCVLDEMCVVVGIMVLLIDWLDIDDVQWVFVE